MLINKNVFEFGKIFSKHKNQNIKFIGTKERQVITDGYFKATTYHTDFDIKESVNCCGNYEPTKKDVVAIEYGDLFQTPFLKKDKNLPITKNILVCDDGVKDFLLADTFKIDIEDDEADLLRKFDSVAPEKKMSVKIDLKQLRRILQVLEKESEFGELILSGDDRPFIVKSNGRENGNEQTEVVVMNCK